MTGWTLVNEVAGPMAGYLGFVAVLMLGFALLKEIGR